jgi:hypothetical protein
VPSQNKSNKGYMMEEALRNYFLKSGYYAIRGVPFIYDEFDVTDIDIWLYGRSSSVSREITIVDIKNKSTPKAIERIFWTQGLKYATNASKAIVATTDNREAVKRFGHELGILVLDGAFLSKLRMTDEYTVQRLNEEEFNALLESYAYEKIDGNWKSRFRHCKSLLTKVLSFDSCNEWLSHAQFFAEQSSTKLKQREIALRCFYFICSLIAISIDYLMKELSFKEQSERKLLLIEGFTYGARGSIGMQKAINVAMNLVEQHVKDGKEIAKGIKKSVDNEFKAMNTIILGEYFSKNEVAKSLFGIAREFEHLSMQRSFIDHSSSTIELRSFLSCLLDYFQIDRVLFNSPN